MSNRNTRRTHAVAVPAQADVQCAETFKTLAKYDEHGIALFCRDGCGARILSWEQINNMYLMAQHKRKSNVRI